MLKRFHRSPLCKLAVVGLFCLLAPAGAAAAGPDDVAPASPTTDHAAGTSRAVTNPGGGLFVPDVPRIDDVICLTGCTRLRSGSPGGTIEISGRALDSVEAVSLKATRGRTKVRPDSIESGRILATIPAEAVTGKIRVIGAGGSKSDPSAATLTIGPAPRAQGKVRVADASSSPAKAFQYGSEKPTLRFIVAGSQATTTLRVDVIDARGTAVQSFFLEDVPTGSPQRTAWSGKIRGGGQAPDGAYRFVIRNADGTDAKLSRALKKRRARASARTTDPFGFRLYRYIFPLTGPHQFWGGIGNGRGHQGIDIGARCGTPIRAARAGTVYWNDYQAGGAGNYLVINTRGNGGKSQVYMHMVAPSRFKAGARIKTGQVIGRVGLTGRTSGCHLHFEQWSGPGWYQGGTYMDPLAALKRWDRYS